MGESRLWQTRGFVCFSAQFSETECQSVANHLVQIDTVGTRCLLNYDWCRVFAVMMQERLVENLPELSSLQVVQCTYFNKRLNENWLVAFHQDRSIPVSNDVSDHYPGRSLKEGITFIHGPDEVLAQMIALRLHLDDSTLANGPLRVLPGSHHYGTLAQDQIQALRPTIDEQPLAIAKGGIIAFHPLLLHASSKSLTTQPRRVLHFLFGPTDLPNGLKWKNW